MFNFRFSNEYTLPLTATWAWNANRAKTSYSLYLLKALYRLRQEKPDFLWELVLTGGQADERTRVERLVQKLDLTEQVTFAGALSPERVRDLLERSHLKVLHSVTPDNGDQEGIPNALMEAMSMELPVLSTLHAGIPELVKDGLHGRLVKEKDIEATVAAILECSQMGYLSHSRTRVIEHFSREQHVRTLLGIYDNRLQSGRCTKLPHLNSGMISSRKIALKSHVRIQGCLDT